MAQKYFFLIPANNSLDLLTGHCFAVFGYGYQSVTETVGNFVFGVDQF